jgi:hypothetical protein
MFKAPKSIWKRIDVMRKRFFWKGANHEGKFFQPMKWDDLYKPKDHGRMGIKSLKEFNDALLLKWAIKLFNGEHKNWVDLIKENYGSSHSSLDQLQPFKPSPFWKSMVQAMKNNWQMFKPILGDGRSFKF